MTIQRPIVPAVAGAIQRVDDGGLAWSPAGGGKLPGPALVHGITGWTASTNYYSGSSGVGDGSDTMTWAMLIRRTGALNSGGIPFAKSNLSSGHLFIYGASNTLQARAYITGPTAKNSATVTITDQDKWYLIVATVSGGSLVIYSQGVAVGSATTGTTGHVTGAVVNSIGSRGAGVASPANTIIAGAATCGAYAMSAAEVAAFYQRVKAQNHLPALPGETTRWDVWSAGQSAPATWQSSASASAPLTRTGSLTQSTYSSEWGV